MEYHSLDYEVGHTQLPVLLLVTVTKRLKGLTTGRSSTLFGAFAFRYKFRDFTSNYFGNTMNY